MLNIIKILLKSKKQTHLRTGAMHEMWVGAEDDIPWRDNGLKLFCRQRPKLRWDHGIHLPMTLQNWSLLVSTSACSLTDQQSGSFCICATFRVLA